MDSYREQIRKIMISVNIIEGIYTYAAKKIGMKENTLVLLYALDDGKNHSQIEISRDWLIPKTTLNTIIKECVEKGYIILTSQKGVKEKNIRLTSEGKKYADSILSIIYDLENKAYLKTLDNDTSDFSNAMTLFANNLNNETKKHFKGKDIYGTK